MQQEKTITHQPICLSLGKGPPANITVSYSNAGSVSLPILLLLSLKNTLRSRCSCKGVSSTACQQQHSMSTAAQHVNSSTACQQQHSMSTAAQHVNSSTACQQQHSTSTAAQHVNSSTACQQQHSMSTAAQHVNSSTACQQQHST